ncbi:DNA recombination protein RmuC [Alloscardovia macacae]|uniref:DNA recombination protein RmuC n=1 Tax=Alloscardovia macacae TaxID=1160091 RepID=A0A1Y2SZL2_9BIFI|nr:DNA recombination protein RmuC [Alloscardovia macacae]OTA27435.1 DNA recombination protein RmuC [Alloscardovia macacae]OTA29446.1 DNA recombination protein RmuC [Alloscardovia macacae]
MFELILTLAIGIALGGALGFFVAKVQEKSVSTTPEEAGISAEQIAQQALQEQKLAQLEVQLREVTSARDQLSAQYEENRSALAAEREATAKLEGQLSGMKEKLEFAEVQLDVAQKAEAERVQRERLAEQKREEERRRQQAQSSQEESRVLKAISPVQQNLEALQRKVAEIEEGRQAEMGKLGEQLLGLGRAQEKLDKETSSLAMALRNNKVRGFWGEAQLKNIVESAGLREHVDFETQYYTTNGEGGKQRPDMIVHLPDEKFIPIDAKVPYSDYQRACEIPDSASEQELKIRDEYLKAHAKALRGHIDELAKRRYWTIGEEERVAPDFVIAFIPNDSLLQAALEADPSIVDYAFSKQVALTSPVTLWSVLKSIAFAWQQQTLSDEAKELFDLSRELFKRLSTMSTHAEKVGSSIITVVKNYNRFVGSLQSQVVPTARKLQALDESKVFKAPEILDDETMDDVREITAPELLADGKEDTK